MPNELQGGPDQGSYWAPWDTGAQWIPPWVMAPEQTGPQGMPQWMWPERGAREKQSWMGAMLPWMQAYQQGQQWGTEFDWRKSNDLWSQAFQESGFDWQKATDLWSQKMQEEMFGAEQANTQWGQGFQEEQLGWQKELEAQRLAQDAETANLQAFGRRWRPNTRWS